MGSSSAQTAGPAGPPRRQSLHVREQKHVPSKLAKYCRYRLVIPGRGRCSYTGLELNRRRGKAFEMDQNPSLCHFKYM